MPKLPRFPGRRPRPGSGPHPSGAPDGRTPRRAARTAVLSPDGSVFLLRSDNREVGVHWTMPGGGLEAGESPADGARRELCEETGWADLDPGHLLCTWEHDFTWHGIPVRQHEHIFLTRGPARGPVGDVSEAHRTDRILGWRWWTPDDLAHPEADALWPPQLPVLLAAVREAADTAAGAAGGAGAAPGPIHLGFVPNGTPNSRPGSPTESRTP